MLRVIHDTILDIGILGKPTNATRWNGSICCDHRCDKSRSRSGAAGDGCYSPCGRREISRSRIQPGAPEITQCEVGGVTEACGYCPIQFRVAVQRKLLQ